ncbi:MAG: hypothetical protein KBH12_09225 [Synergistaceae bacterium]|nr:hypothetical protein [Synergistaceae bacterium]
MANIIGMVSFTLKKGVSESDFLLVHEKYNREFVSKQNGYITHKLLVNGDKWTDLVIWESMDDTQNTFEAVGKNAVAIEVMSLIDQIGNDDDIPLFSVVKNY